MGKDIFRAFLKVWAVRLVNRRAEVKEEPDGILETLDEGGANEAIDSVIPIRNAEIQGQDVNVSRVNGYTGNALHIGWWRRLDQSRSKQYRLPG